MGSRYRWYTPFWQQRVAPLGADLSTTYSQVVQLLTPEGLFADTISETDIRVTRIIGQYRVSFGGVEFPDAICRYVFLHHRMYVVSGDGTNVFNRDLTLANDADSDMMWNQVEMFGRSQIVSSDQAIYGTWGINGASSVDSAQTVRPFMNGRMGHFDVKVDRRVEEGESLCWKTQLEAGSPGAASGPDAGFMYLDLWLRCLVKTYG